MGILLISIIALFLFRLLVYENLEITPLKYCVLKLMAAQSTTVDRELTKLLNHKIDYKILNKEYKRLEKIFVGRLNTYLFEFRHSEIQVIRKALLKTNKLEL
jgi:hypothetical protein